MTGNTGGPVMTFRDGAAVHARICGPVNRETVDPIQRRVESAAGEHCRTLTLDLGAADYVDSDGVRWLQRFHVALSERGVELRLAVREGSRIDRTVRLLQLDRILHVDVYPEERPGRSTSLPA